MSTEYATGVMPCGINRFSYLQMIVRPPKAGVTGSIGGARSATTDARSARQQSCRSILSGAPIPLNQSRRGLTRFCQITASEANQYYGSSVDSQANPLTMRFRRCCRYWHVPQDRQTCRIARDKRPHHLLPPIRYSDIFPSA